MGVLTDGIISCSCGKGVLEIKCPYFCPDKSFLSKSKWNTFPSVYRAHYFQVQAKLYSREPCTVSVNLCSLVDMYEEAEDDLEECCYCRKESSCQIICK